MAKAKKSAEQPAQADAPVIVAYKGFGPDWKCRDFQYAIGEMFTHEGKAVACERPILAWPASYSDAAGASS